MNVSEWVPPASVPEPASDKQASKHPETRKYLDTALFGSYRIEWGNLVWGDYGLCFPLKSLYEDALQESPLQAVAELALRMDGKRGKYPCSGNRRIRKIRRRGWGLFNR